MEIKLQALFLRLFPATVLLGGCSYAPVKPIADRDIAGAEQARLEYATAGKGSPVIVFLSPRRMG